MLFLDIFPSLTSTQEIYSDDLGSHRMKDILPDPLSVLCNSTGLSGYASYPYHKILYFWFPVVSKHNIFNKKYMRLRQGTASDCNKIIR